jgi:TRAP-type C4-dicarboxylate transport system permease large subunit
MGRRPFTALSAPAGRSHAVVVLAASMAASPTPTEASVIAVVYAILVGMFIHRESAGGTSIRFSASR